MTAPRHFESDAHCLTTGGIFALVHAEAARDDSMLASAEVETDEVGNYRPFITVEAFGKRFRVIVAEIP